MDLSSKKLPLILIVILLGILVAQYLYNDSESGKFVDPETCEIYIKDPRLDSKHYLDEFDSKCLDFKNIIP